MNQSSNLILPKSQSLSVTKRLNPNSVLFKCFVFYTLSQYSSDEGMVVHDTSASIQGLGGPITRARTKKAKEALTQLMAKVLESKPTLESMDDKMVMCIKPLEEGWGASVAAHFI
ncbi:hypothetical protein MTR_7g059155 [Medicago truncatula]|uniref:Uncharacterized protein n=1 Tax=Medicago truncatula TaxID=3880 RepID=A0A072U070_MEDTR|nr:hypothetical protein MTR_7g059155 [Medicago truncatula]